MQEGVFKRERGTTLGTKGTTSAQNGSVYLSYETPSTELEFHKEAMLGVLVSDSAERGRYHG
jgi:hypothetical protein